MAHHRNPVGTPGGGVHGGQQGVLINREAQGPGSSDPGGQHGVLTRQESQGSGSSNPGGQHGALNRPEAQGPGSQDLGGHNTDLKKKVNIDGLDFWITPCTQLDIQPAFRDQDQDYNSMAGESSNAGPSINQPLMSTRNILPPISMIS